MTLNCSSSRAAAVRCRAVCEADGPALAVRWAGAALTVMLGLALTPAGRAATPATPTAAPTAATTAAAPPKPTIASPSAVSSPGAAPTPSASVPAGGFACLIEPFQRIELRSGLEARIEAIHVDRGSEVKKGQVLVELDSGAERAALEGARYRAVMDGAIRSADSRSQAAKQKLARREELVREKYISAQDRDDARLEMQVAEADAAEARDNRRLAQIEQRRLGELVEQRRLRSPFQGVVTERLQHVGEVAQAGEGARPILKLAQTHPLRVEVILPVALYGQLRKGGTARVEVERPLSGSYTATVAVVDRVVDSASGTFGVRLELPNPEGTIPAGVKCRVQFAGDGAAR